MKLLVLGAGDAAGIPAWNDGSPRALRARAGDARDKARARRIREAGVDIAWDGMEIEA